MPELHAFTNEVDILIARDIGDAWQIWQEHTGESDESYREELYQMPDDAPIGIWWDGEKIAELGQGEVLTLTAAEWVAREGRGFLCSTEY